MKSAYISCPMIVPQVDLNEVVSLVRSSNVTPHWWSKGSPYDEIIYTKVIQQANAFIVILPDMGWSCYNYIMTPGSRKELCIAILAKKPIFIAYKRSNSTIGIYAASIGAGNTENLQSESFTRISGISSTQYNFRDIIGSQVQKLPSTAEKITQRNQAAANKEYNREIPNQHKTWTELAEEKYKEYGRSIEKAIFPTWVDTSVIPPANLEKIMRYFAETGILSFNYDLKLDINILPDNRILLFF